MVRMISRVCHAAPALAGMAEMEEVVGAVMAATGLERREQLVITMSHTHAAPGAPSRIPNRDTESPLWFLIVMVSRFCNLGRRRYSQPRAIAHVPTRWPSDCRLLRCREGWLRRGRCTGRQRPTTRLARIWPRPMRPSTKSRHVGWQERSYCSSWCWYRCPRHCCRARFGCIGRAVGLRLWHSGRSKGR
eukprot:SAG31_NODE_1062_length_10105_cov_11.143814_6_plen_189_part_00